MAIMRGDGPRIFISYHTGERSVSLLSFWNTPGISMTAQKKHRRAEDKRGGRSEMNGQLCEIEQVGAVKREGHEKNGQDDGEKEDRHEPFVDPEEEFGTFHVLGI